jgi:hypothetical protein
MKKVKALLEVLILATLLAGCASTKKEPEVVAKPIEAPEPLPGAPVVGDQTYILSWNKTAPKGQEATRAAWTKELMKDVEIYYSALNSATDLKAFCPSYYSMSKEDQKQFWGELFTRVAYKESSFNPNTVYHESFGVDSIGLFQLSYEDKPNYPDVCAWTALKDPIQNIQCGVGVAAKWVGRDKLLTQGTSSKTAKGMARYWSTMRTNSSAYSYIKGFTQKLPYCN